MFDSFSEFVNPYPTRKSYESICHLVPVLNITQLVKYKKYSSLGYPTTKDPNCCRSPLIIAFRIPDIHFSAIVLFIDLRFLLELHVIRVYSVKDPIKKNNPSRYIGFAAICCTVCTGYKVPSETYQRYAQKTLGTKTILSRRVTKFPFADAEKNKIKNGEMLLQFCLDCHIWQPSNYVTPKRDVLVT